MGIVAKHREAVIDMVRAGLRTGDIALTLGLQSPHAISMALSDDPEYQAAGRIGEALRLEALEEQLARAADSVSVTRADRLINHQHWRMERRFPDQWGAKQSVTHSVAGNVQVDMGFAGDILQARRVFTELPAPTHTLATPDTHGDGEDGADGGHAE